MNTPELTLYFDGACPFCRTEMVRVSGWDTDGRLAFVDIAAPGFDPAELGLTMEDLGREVVSRTATGELLIGIDTIWTAYALVGRAWLAWPLRVPGLRCVLAWLYRGFARHRYLFSRLLGYRAEAPCKDGVCDRSAP
jgi:predicted DCC family thiol-disulfide oxidoreductase YuxK